MEKPKFEYETLDQALAGEARVNRDKIEKTNPEGFGPETKKAFEDIYAQAEGYKERHVKVLGMVGREGFIDAAVKHAQFEVYNILAARELEHAESLDDVQSVACNIKVILECLKEEPDYWSGMWRWHRVIGDNMRKIGLAVAKDLGLTIEKAEKLSAKYDSLCAAPTL